MEPFSISDGEQLVAYSYELYSGDGVTKIYPVQFPYLNPSHVKVKVGGVEVPYVFINSGSISITSTPPSGVYNIEISRDTPKDGVAVDFVDGSILKETDLDLLAASSLYIAQETSDKVERAVYQTSTGDYSVKGFRLSNVASPIEDTDAATKGYADKTVDAAQGFSETASSASLISISKAAEAANSASLASGYEEAAAVSAYEVAATAASFNDANILHKTGSEDIAGIKTFTSSPIVPEPLSTDDSFNVSTTGWVRKFIKSATETIAGIAKIATQTLTDAGIDDSTLITPKKLKTFVNNRVWQNVLPSRTQGVTYTNSNGRQIGVSVEATAVGSGAGVAIEVKINGLSLGSNYSVPVSTQTPQVVRYFEVPDGATYVVTVAPGNLTRWVEGRGV